MGGIASLFGGGGGAGGGQPAAMPGGGGGGGGENQFSDPAQFDPQLFDAPAYDPQNFFTNPLNMAALSMGSDPLASGNMGVGGVQQWPSDAGSGTETDPNARAAQGGATPPSAAPDTQSTLSQIAKALSPVGSAQAKDMTLSAQPGARAIDDRGGMMREASYQTPSPLGDAHQQAIKYLSPQQREQFFQQHRNLDQPHPGTEFPLDTGSATQPGMSGGAEPAPEDFNPQLTAAANVPIPRERPQGQIPLPPERPPIPLPTARPSGAPTAPPEAPPETVPATTVAGATPPAAFAAPTDPITAFLESIFPGLGQALHGVANQTSPSPAPPGQGQPVSPLQRIAGAIGNAGQVLTGQPPSHGWERQRRQQELKRNLPPPPGWEHIRGVQDMKAQQAALGTPSESTGNIDPQTYTRALWNIEGPARTGSNVGRAQFGPDEIRKYGNPNDPRSVEREAADHTRILRGALGRDPQPWELYVTHQQGIAGGPALLTADPNMPAWEAVRRFYKSDAIAKSAIHGNIYGPLRGEPVENITAGQFNDWWKDRFNRELARGGNAPASAPRQIAESRPQTPPMRGAQRGNDGRWYVHRNGRWYRVRYA